PGVYSARYAGEGCSYADNNARLLRALEGVPPEARRASFRCVIALCSPDGSAVTAEGRVRGRILEEPRGADGFGYDPLFLPDGESLSFAELPAEEKNSMSHRSAAVRNILPRLEKLADEQG
ncbi:MAG TPA: non-canonical purine NTP pyrophosphatase, partial [Elusimicrobia bacterium]|nr:non-canonical purine NTP pyrophosphatase [Elusimicrobiota bacterium]